MEFASVVWAIIGYFYGFDSYPVREWVIEDYKYCLHTEYGEFADLIPKDNKDNTDPCGAKFEENYPKAIKESQLNGILFALIPIPLGWIIIGGLYGTGRWIRAGRAMKAAIIAGCVVLSTFFGASEAPAKTQQGRWEWNWPPPAEYDFPYAGVLMIQQLPIDQIQKICLSNNLACTMVISVFPYAHGGKGGMQVNVPDGNHVGCIIIMAPDSYFREHQQNPKAVLRHEIAHCNGWPADHPNSKSGWEWVER